MKQSMKANSIADLLTLTHKKYSHPILVIGDIMLDHYLFGNVERISPEAPVPVVHIESEEYKLGGAANVANNIKKLYGKTYLMGVVGEDLNGNILEKLLRDNNISNTLLKKKNYTTTTKTRIIAKSQQLLRIDKELTSVDYSGELAKLVKKVMDNYKVIVISDYGKGAIGSPLLKTLHCSSSFILIDPKPKNFQNYREPYIITPNKKEAEIFSGIQINGKQSLLKAGDIILKKTGAHNLLITLGEDGMVLFEDQGKVVLHLPALGRKVYDVTGAGDTVLSALALGLAKEMSLLESCIFANICAGIVVGKRGTAFPTWDEIFLNSNKWNEYLKITQW